MTLTSRVPTHIFTGFLGSGKTTAILHLLANKPAEERWAILVNEFGEIGIDGNLFQGQVGDGHSVAIKEVPGGCMCCASGLPMQIALNQLIQRTKPDRLFIEPTGLGHPHEVLATLSAEHYQPILAIQKIVTFVDARHLSDDRYRQHKTFQDQVAIADLVIGNKQDLYTGDEQDHLTAYVRDFGQAHAEVGFTEHGELSLDTLIFDRTASHTSADDGHHHHHGTDAPLASDLPLPECGYLSARNQGAGFESIGWRFSPDFVFDKDALFVFLSGLVVERFKGVFRTNEGNVSYNMSDQTLTEKPLSTLEESRAEIIAQRIDPSWEHALTSCAHQA